MRILIASANPHKIEEIRRMLPLRFDIVSAAEFDIEFPPEVGTTFRENAVAKADFASSASGLPAIADDSGLVVPALGGAPGVRSARYAGVDATDAENVSKLSDEQVLYGHKLLD